MTESGEHTITAPMLFGIFYPKGHIVAIIDDEAQATQAQAAVRQAGFPEVDVFTSQEVLAKHQAMMDKRNLAERLGSLVGADEKLFQEDYLEEVRAGKLILTVHVPNETQVRDAAQVLAEQGASMMRYYAQHGVAEL